MTEVRGEKTKHCGSQETQNSLFFSGKTMLELKGWNCNSVIERVAGRHVDMRWHT